MHGEECPKGYLSNSKCECFPPLVASPPGVLFSFRGTLVLLRYPYDLALIQSPNPSLLVDVEGKYAVLLCMPTGSDRFFYKRNKNQKAFRT